MRGGGDKRYLMLMKCVRKSVAEFLYLCPVGCGGLSFFLCAEARGSSLPAAVAAAHYR